jgi:hypothetical protein
MRNFFAGRYGFGLKLYPATVIHGKNFTIQIQQRIKGIVIFHIHFYPQSKLSSDDNMSRGNSIHLLLFSIIGQKLQAAVSRAPINIAGIYRELTFSGI